jgi:hypothetical protein
MMTKLKNAIDSECYAAVSDKHLESTCPIHFLNVG